MKRINMHIKTWISAFVIAAFILGYGSSYAQALSPMETVKNRIDQVIDLLNDPRFKDPGSRGAQRDKIWEIASPMFDFKEISRRTVGPSWEKFSEEQKEQFTKVFSEFLGNTYLDRVQGEYQNEQVVYVSEAVREPQALVRTQLVREKMVMPIDYRMRLDGGQWKIYDVLVENGVSIVQNYRVQFQSILQKENPDQLIARLEQRLQERKF
jgi:phospholipid transport system substrate-binding protein